MRCYYMSFLHCFSFLKWLAGLLYPCLV
uniref:Uncharacterized protein n=1 Tax=Rhizophora mucronata TaxID=61149 RepID=A0A2P2PJL0_RHIMU